MISPFFVRIIKINLGSILVSRCCEDGKCFDLLIFFFCFVFNAFVFLELQHYYVTFLSFVHISQEFQMDVMKFHDYCRRQLKACLLLASEFMMKLVFNHLADLQCC